MLPNLKSLSLRFLNQITGESLKAIIDNMKGLEGLDLSGCMNVDLAPLTKLRNNTSLKGMLLEFLNIKSEHIKALKETQITTLSIFCKPLSTFIDILVDSKTVNFTHLEAIKEL